jgi:hypothetical protein
MSDRHTEKEKEVNVELARERAQATVDVSELIAFLGGIQFGLAQKHAEMMQLSE